MYSLVDDVAAFFKRHFSWDEAEVPVPVAESEADGGFSPFPEEVPEPLIEQLAVGGRLVIPVGGWSQDLRVLERTEEGVRTTRLFPVRFVPLTRSED